MKARQSLLAKSAFSVFLYLHFYSFAIPQIPLPAPIVVATTPTLGARRVDPSLAEIEVRFDQPMKEGSWSFCGGGEHFPVIAGAIRNPDSYSVAMPVDLEPEHTYFLSFNCGARNFVSAVGVPLASTPFHFTTGPGDEWPPSAVTNYASFTEFRRLFRDQYSYFDRTGIDWDAKFADAQEWILASPTEEEWIVRVSMLLSDAHDIHMSFVDSAGKRVSTWRAEGNYNGNPARIREAFPNLKRPHNFIAIGRQGDVAYLSIDSWSDSPGFEDTMNAAMKQIRDAPTLILDVRANGGGSENNARFLASYFVNERRIYAKHRTRDPQQSGGWSAIRERAIIPRPVAERYRGRVFVLQGPRCFSSNEAFLLMMRQAPRAVSVGDVTGGSSAAPRRYPLPNGYAFVIPSWIAYTPDGTPFEGVGLSPDVFVTGDFTNHDPVLKEAMRLAREPASD